MEKSDIRKTAFSGNGYTFSLSRVCLATENLLETVLFRKKTLPIDLAVRTGQPIEWYGSLNPADVTDIKFATFLVWKDGEKLAAFENEIIVEPIIKL